MESKKGHGAFSEDSPSCPVSPISTVFRPRSPFRSGRRSGASRASSELSFSPSENDRLSDPISCVTRQTFVEDCARHRFIVWAAVKRNSCSRLKPEEKLRCPLLRCNRLFSSHELMLRHLVGCEHLASGEYLCPEHMRIERFDDVKCKHCLGHPSKRRRMLSFAKNFFHTIGHRSKRGQDYESLPEDPSFPPPPYPSFSLSRQVPLANELAVTEFVPVEADSREVQPLPTTSVDTVINPQALHIPDVPELDSTSPFTDWYTTPQQTSGRLTALPATLSDNTGFHRPVNRPTLQVNTTDLQRPGKATSRPSVQPSQQAPRSKFLAPSSSVRSNASTDSNVSAASNDSSLISPMSAAWSYAGFNSSSGFNTNLTSPVDGCSADNNPFALSSVGCLPTIHDFISELPADNTDADLASDLLPNTLLLSFGQEVSLVASYARDLALTDDYEPNLFDVGNTTVQHNNVCCSDTKTLVQTVWDALQEHILSSTLRLQHVFGNPLSHQFCSMSAKSIAAAGIRTLKSLSAGERPSAAIDTICFIHLMYAFCLAIDEYGAAHRSKELFLQSLAYAHDFDASETDSYMQLVKLIWQPDDIGLDALANMQRSLVIRGKQTDRGTSCTNMYGDDALLNVSFDFLDELDISVLLGQLPASPAVQTSGLYMKHLLDFGVNSLLNTPFPVAVNVGVQGLLQDYSDAPGLRGNLTRIRQRVACGDVASVRRLELELIDAGKGCMRTSNYYTNYVPDIRKLCNPMYQHHGSDDSQRKAYHVLGVSLIEDILAQLDANAYQQPEPNGADDLNLDDFMQGLTPDCELQHSTFMGSTPMTETLEQPLSSGMPGTTIGNMPQGQQEETLINNSLAKPNVIISSSDAQQGPEPQQGPAPQEQQEIAFADSCCHLCGYRPKGEPRWFKGSMAKHMKNKHSAKTETYKCPFPGCNSQYTNRKDNLRQHQIDKGHFVEGEEPAIRRPSKRKKRDHEDDEGK